MRCSSDSFDWNCDTVAQLTSLWTEGVSTAEIGRRLGISKNAVVGKCHRLNLPARPSPIQKEGARKPPAPARPRCPGLAELQNRKGNTHVLAAVRGASLPARLDPAGSEPLLQTAREMITDPAAVLGRQPCSWPLGEPGTRAFRFCDAPTEAGRPYCPEHCGVAYRRRQRVQTAA